MLHVFALLLGGVITLLMIAIAASRVANSTGAADHGGPEHSLQVLF